MDRPKEIIRLTRPYPPESGGSDREIETESQRERERERERERNRERYRVREPGRERVR